MKKMLFVMSIAGLLAACGPSKEKILSEVRKAEASLAADSGGVRINEKLAADLLGQYRHFAQTFPHDSLAPDFLYKGAKLYISLAKYDSAIQLLNKVYSEHPGYSKAPECLFLQGFIYDENLKNTAAAGKKYEEFLSKFPQHELAASARFLMENLGKSDEELIRDLEARNSPADSSADAAVEKTK